MPHPEIDFDELEEQSQSEGDEAADEIQKGRAGAVAQHTHNSNY